MKETMKFSRKIHLLAVGVAQSASFVSCAASTVAAPTPSATHVLNAAPGGQVDPAQMQKMIAKSKELGELQRKFEEQGAAKPSSLKTQEDVESRIVLLDQLIKVTNEQAKMIRENGGNAQDGEVFSNLQGMQKQSRVQLVFLKNYFGKWKVGTDGEVEYTVPKPDLDAFNKSIHDFNDIRIKQLELLRARAEARRKLKGGSVLD
jgi:hypothetical protein